MNGPLDPEFLKTLTTRGILPGDDDGGGEEEEDIGEEEEESEKRDSGYGSQGQIKKPVSVSEEVWIIDG